jgi:hypothetical protein
MCPLILIGAAFEDIVIDVRGLSDFADELVPGKTRLQIAGFLHDPWIAIILFVGRREAHLFLKDPFVPSMVVVIDGRHFAFFDGD